MRTPSENLEVSPRLPDRRWILSQGQIDSSGAVVSSSVLNWGWNGVFQVLKNTAVSLCVACGPLGVQMLSPSTQTAKIRVRSVEVCVAEADQLPSFTYVVTLPSYAITQVVSSSILTSDTGTLTQVDGPNPPGARIFIAPSVFSQTGAATLTTSGHNTVTTLPSYLGTLPVYSMSQVSTAVVSVPLLAVPTMVTTTNIVKDTTSNVLVAVPAFTTPTLVAAVNSFTPGTWFNIDSMAFSLTPGGSTAFAPSATAVTNYPAVDTFMTTLNATIAPSAYSNITGLVFNYVGTTSGLSGSARYTADPVGTGKISYALNSNPNLVAVSMYVADYSLTTSKFSVRDPLNVAVDASRDYLDLVVDTYQGIVVPPSAPVSRAWRLNLPHPVDLAPGEALLVTVSFFNFNVGALKQFVPFVRACIDDVS